MKARNVNNKRTTHRATVIPCHSDSRPLVGAARAAFWGKGPTPADRHGKAMWNKLAID